MGPVADCCPKLRGAQMPEGSRVRGPKAAVYHQAACAFRLQVRRATWGERISGDVVVGLAGTRWSGAMSRRLLKFGGGSGDDYAT